jgi:hypothetical protein
VIIYISACLILKILSCARRERLCVSYGSQEKAEIFPYTPLSDWFLKRRLSAFTA